MVKSFLMGVHLAQVVPALCCICTVLMWLFCKHLFCSLAVGLCSSLTSERGVEMLQMQPAWWSLWSFLLAYGAAIPTRRHLRIWECRGFQEKQSLLIFRSRGKQDWVKLNYFYATKTFVNLISEAWVWRIEIIIPWA